MAPPAPDRNGGLGHSGNVGNGESGYGYSSSGNTGYGSRGGNGSGLGLLWGMIIVTDMAYGIWSWGIGLWRINLTCVLQERGTS